MECNKNYSCLEKNENVFSKSIEIEEDFSESLPAYCDDIYRVVKCRSHCFINSVSISEHEITVMGKCEIMLTYYNENSALCYADFEEEFSRSVNVDELSNYAFATVDICDKYTNFRVINQRRIDIHSSASASLAVYDRVKCPCINECSDAKLRRQTVKSADIVASNISRIEFDEEFSLPADYDSVKRIISSECTACLTESRIIKDKVLIKAEVKANILYTSDAEEERILSASNTFSVSKIIDQSGIEENDIMICNVGIGNMFHKAKSASGDKLCVIELFGEICVNSLFIREKEESLVTDGYMVKSTADCSYSSYKSLSNGLRINESKLFNLSLDFSDDIKEIKEIGVSLSTPVIRNSKLVSKAETSVIYENESGVLSSMSASKEISFDSNGREYAFSDISVKNTDYTIPNSKRIDLRLGVDINAYFCDKAVYNVLSDIDEGEAKEKAPSLTLYFAKENSDIWNIAKSFSSDSELIMRENELNSETLDKDRILIIPRV